MSLNQQGKIGEFDVPAACGRRLAAGVPTPCYSTHGRGSYGGRDSIMINLPMSDDVRHENAALLAEIGGTVTYREKRERVLRASRQRDDGYRSQLEADYAGYLSARGLAFHYEVIHLDIGEDLQYTPDFDFVDTDGVFTVVEIKGSRKMRNARDSLTRFKVAAAMYPRWRWQWIERSDGEWVVKYEYGVKS